MVKRLVAAMVVVGLLATVGVGVSAANREAWIPAIASFAIPGLGQLLNDEIDKAIVHFGIDVVILIGGGYLSALMPWGWYGYSAVGLAHLVWAVYSGYDAYTVAKEQGFSIGLTEDGLMFSYRF
jgi:ribulose 1,5-bisphosphate carboxylase large subunit-like protein